MTIFSGLTNYRTWTPQALITKSWSCRCWVANSSASPCPSPRQSKYRCRTESTPAPGTFYPCPRPAWPTSRRLSRKSVKIRTNNVLTRTKKNLSRLPMSLPPIPTPFLSHFHPEDPSAAPNLSDVEAVVPKHLRTSACCRFFEQTQRRDLTSQFLKSC